MRKLLKENLQHKQPIMKAVKTFFSFAFSSLREERAIERDSPRHQDYKNTKTSLIHVQPYSTNSEAGHKLTKDTDKPLYEAKKTTNLGQREKSLAVMSLPSVQ